MVDWIKRVELTCHLCGIKQVKLVIPLRLTGGTPYVYQQLSDNEKADVGVTKAALHSVRMIHYPDILMAEAKTVDVFFVALKNLVVLFGGLSEWTFVYAFMAGLLA